MSDFFSFEYFDEIPDEGFDSTGPDVYSRKNLSLSAESAEYLREAMTRLVPSTFVYGESGIGERAYELYGLCVGHAFTGRRSNNLIAALCVMHASYERRSDLVILPSDIEARYTDMQLRVIRVTNILSTYDSFCELLKLPRLDVSMEKLLHRVFRFGCNMTSEADISRFTDTGLRFEREIRSVTEYKPPVSKRRVNYRQKFRVETVAAVCSILACRYHNYTAATANSIVKELHIAKATVYYLLNKYKKSHPPPAGPDSQRSPTKKRSDPLYVGGLDVPSGVSKRRRDEQTARGPTDEIVALVPVASSVTQSALTGDDPLGFLYDFQDLLDVQPLPNVQDDARLDVLAIPYAEDGGQLDEQPLPDAALAIADDEQNSP